ncbi:prolyl-tRNA synthetase associated domain-containing protein [Lentimicrobium sp. S6]|uniref:prolyl-tRNA synthetase associated domain-containing protein n=1 Tax=Lentimicrobium sp. S6 TaxID=2735872 RepID=UPI0015547296|nr:prolyl-tRNA synthetase associated domain-containing protein [Lentimicrobium sp. S6]NPD44833.1 prolyl-tRNA synthetase associated domain-containing protein [Lentimicrobium sp. S6]
MELNDRNKVFEVLKELNIECELHEHPPTPTIEEAVKYWGQMKSTHCKNLFFRNHKGNKHYLVIFEHQQQLMIRDLEQKLKQGKLSFASEKRMSKYLGVKPGSVSLFGLINDNDNHVYVFFDKNLLNSEFLSFHPNDNTASLKISQSDFQKFLIWSGNEHEFLDLY